MLVPTPSSPAEGRIRLIVSWIGLGAGPLFAVLAYLLLPAEYTNGAGEVLDVTNAGRITLGLMLWMAVWWMTEAVAIEATSFLPVVVLPLSGATTIVEASTPYASPVIFLFLGGFLLALSMQRWGLDRRIALMTLRVVGTRPRNMVGGMMVATAVMSACVSNTATVAMMIPIALGVSRFVDEGAADNFRTSLLLSIAYAASIGGLATIIGSPANGFLAQYSSTELQLEITFLDWLKVGLPVTLVLLPITWLLLTRFIFAIPSQALAEGSDSVRKGLRELGPVNLGERLTLLVFLATVTCWVARPAIAKLVPGITDAGIAIGAGLLLFVLPVGRGGMRTLDWETAKKLPWGVLVLFGGALSLAAAVGEFGVAELIGAGAVGMGQLSPFWTVFAITTGMVFLTELTSNTATAATMIPLLAALAPGFGVSALELVVPATLAASCAFMLPVATPPNAIVFGSGHISMPQMMRAGLWLNLVAVILLTLLCHFLIVPNLLGL